MTSPYAGAFFFASLQKKFSKKVYLSGWVEILSRKVVFCFFALHSINAIDVFGKSV